MANGTSSTAITSSKPRNRIRSGETTDMLFEGVHFWVVFRDLNDQHLAKVSWILESFAGIKHAPELSQRGSTAGHISSSSSTSKVKTELEQLKEAIRQRKITHIIAQDIFYDGYQEAKESGIHIVTPQWVDRSVEKNQRLEEHLFSPDPMMFFAGECIHATVMEDEERAILYTGVEHHGGSFSLQFNANEVTMLVSKFANGGKSDQAKRAGIPIVLPEYFDLCFQLQARLPIEPFLHPNPSYTRMNPDDFTSTKTATGGAGAQEKSIKNANLGFLKGLIIYFSPDLKSTPLLMVNDAMERIRTAGAILSNELTPDVTYAILLNYNAQLPESIIQANLYWVSEILTHGYISPLSDILFTPPPLSKLKEFSKCRIAVSNYTGLRRQALGYLITELGGTYTKTLTRENTHLITSVEAGEKYRYARTWGLHVVNHLWVEECVKQWKYVRETSQRKFTIFVPGVETCGAGYGFTKRFREVASGENASQSQNHAQDETHANGQQQRVEEERPRTAIIPPPSAATSAAVKQKARRTSEEDHDAPLRRKRKFTSEEGSTDTAATTQKTRKVVIVFTGIRPSDTEYLVCTRQSHVLRTGIVKTWSALHGPKTQTVKSLGGSILDSPIYKNDPMALISNSTHLICEKATRTEKFLLALTLGKQIVNKHWLYASHKKGYWLPESSYPADDDDLFDKYGVRLGDVKGGGKCCDGMVFYVTENVNPDREILKRLIEAAGGKVLGKLTPESVRRLQQPLIVISSEQEQPSWRMFTEHGLNVYAAELILTGLLKQELDLTNNDWVLASAVDDIQ